MSVIKQSGDEIDWREDTPVFDTFSRKEYMLGIASSPNDVSINIKIDTASAYTLPSKGF